MDTIVSIIVITYNSEKYVLETLESTKAQTYRNIELIVTDDCSTDGTVNVCRKWLEENSDRFVSSKVITTAKNSGIPANCNNGIKASQGEWIKLLAGDDLLFPNAIEIFMNAVSGDTSGEKSAFHGIIRVIQNNHPLITNTPEYGEAGAQKFNQDTATAEEQFNILLRFCPVSGPTSFLKRTIFERVGYFDERFKYWEDRPMWLKMTSNGIKFYFINADITNYRRHDQSVQINSNGTLFSRTLLSKDDGSRAVILPHLPFTERILNLYVFSVRRLFFRVFRNKKTLLINIPYKILVIFAEKWLNRIRSRYSP
jgi:glycosyltransferase involved in cell wall biosynthesis